MPRRHERTPQSPRAASGHAGERCCGPAAGPPGALDAAAQALRALADPTRLGILALLAENETLCVCHLVQAFPLGQPTISHHLRLLREAGFVDCARRGTWCYYFLRPAARPVVAWALALPAALALSAAPVPKAGVRNKQANGGEGARGDLALAGNLSRERMRHPTPMG